MKKILLSLLLVLSLFCSLLACAPAYEGDARIGSYIAYGADGKTVVYRLTLTKNGTGEMIHYPTIGGETREEIIFTFEENVLVLHGTEVVGGVIGRNEFLGTAVLSEEKYSVELRSVDSSAPLATFVQE